MSPPRPPRSDLAEHRELGILYLLIAALHLVGWGVCVGLASQHPALVGMGVAAYVLGLRHAFDADHIAAVDDTIRLMLHSGRNPLGVGFFFSLGHSTVVLAACIGVVVAASAFRAQLGAWQDAGATVGGAVSGVFLLVVGLVNLRVLLDIARAWRTRDDDAHAHAHAEAALARRGGLARWLRGKRAAPVMHSWQMYAVGLLFGLGFDTASEIALLALAAGAAATSLPWPAVLSLPVLFAAGMSLVDTTDGVFMCKAYRWALVEPRRRLVYNLATTAFSVAIALVVGAAELARTSVDTLHLAGPFAARVRDLDFGSLGYVIVAVFAFAWTAARLGRRFNLGRRAAAAARAAR